MAIVALLAFFILAITNWIAVAQERQDVEYVAKPAVLVALLLYAAAGHASPWLIAALGFSLLGDVYLMLPEDLFIPGVGAFLIAHLAYIKAFDATFFARATWLVVILILSSPLAFQVLKAIKDDVIKPAMVLYLLVLSFMAASAFASGNKVAALGAVLFLTSDGILAWNRFVRPLPSGHLAVMVTYHIAQLALVTALRSGG